MSESRIDSRVAWKLFDKHAVIKCVRIVERNRLPVTRNLLFPSIRVAATPPAKTRLAVTS